MSVDIGSLPHSGGGLKRFFYRPPWVGLLAFVVVFVVQALGHTVMIMMEDIWPGPGYVYESALAMGVFGGVLLWWGMRHKNEVSATWYGFWAGTFLWTGWVEFSFVWSAQVLGVPDLMDPLVPVSIATKGEYLVMMSSVGVLGATLIYFLFNKETKCNFFISCYFFCTTIVFLVIAIPSLMRHFSSIPFGRFIYFGD